MRILLAATLLAAAPLAAQNRANDPAVQRAMATITETDYRNRVALLAHDSMRGRGTPSPELEETANWIASEFRRWSLRPGGDSGTFFQRYRMRRTQIDTAQSFLMFTGGNAGQTQWQAGRDAFYGGTLDGGELAHPVTGPVVVVSGTPADTARPFAGAARGAVAMMIVPAANMRALQPYVSKARDAGIVAFVIVANVPRDQFTAAMARTLRANLALVTGATETPGLPVYVVTDSTAMSLLRAAGEDIVALRAGQNSGVRMLPGINATVQMRRTTLSEDSAPNVIGIVEGSDPQLRNEYVFFTAHMDHVGAAGMGNGCTARGADSICNGADDDASGTSGVVMLARAFSQTSPRPRRSTVFMLVSGEERGLWGSEYYSENPTLPVNNTVAAINLDMIGRNWRDTISVIGKEHSTLGETANRISRDNPELGMQLVDDLWPRENFYRRSDHFNFARKGVPILFFFNGVHPEYHQVTDTADRINAEKAARIVKMVFLIGLDVANTADRPQWNPASRAAIVQ